MKLSQIVDKEVEQNEIESKYIWYPALRGINRINLSAFAIDCFVSLPNSISITHCMPLPNNQIYGIGFENFGKHHQCQFISDENLNIKIIEISAKNAYNHSYFARYYDGSIFTFERTITTCRAQRYLISQNKWIQMYNLPFKFPVSVIGFNQKLLITVDNSELYGIWVYDINLDNYSHFTVSNFYKKACKTVFKYEAKIYLVTFREFYEIYVTDNILSEWTFVSECKENKFFWQFCPNVLYDKSIYYLRDLTLYKFELMNFELKAVAKLNGTSVNEII